MEGIVDEETKGETDIYSVVAEEERKQELKEEAATVARLVFPIIQSIGSHKVRYNVEYTYRYHCDKHQNRNKPPSLTADNINKEYQCQSNGVPYVLPKLRIGDDNLRRILHLRQRFVADYILAAGRGCVDDWYDACAETA